MTTATVTKGNEENTTATNQMFIHKIQMKGNFAEIDYSYTTDLFKNVGKQSGQEEVTKEFKQTFQDTIEGFIGVFPIFAKEKNKLTMNCINFYYDKTSYLTSALYSVKYAFNDQNNAVVNINTPKLPIYKEGMENCFTISGKHETALHEVIKCAKAYINGETRTKQMKLVVDNA